MATGGITCKVKWGGGCSAERGGRGARRRLWETVPCCGHLPPVRRLPQPLQEQEACFLTQFSPRSLFSCSLVMLLACQSDTAACRAVCYNRFTVPSKFSGKVLCQAAWLNWRHLHHHSLLSNKKKKWRRRRTLKEKWEKKEIMSFGSDEIDCGCDAFEEWVCPLSLEPRYPSLGPWVRHWAVLERALESKSGDPSTFRSPCNLGQAISSPLGSGGCGKPSNHIYLLLKQPVSLILQTVKLSKKKVCFFFFLWNKRIMYFCGATETKTQVEGLGSGSSSATS